MGAWLTRHAQTSIGSLGRLSQHKLATLLTILVIGIALALPACLHLLIDNAQNATGNWNRAVDLTVFLKRPTSVEDATRTADRIRKRRDVSNVELITADAALKDFRRDSGFGPAIDALNDNPLPHTLVVTPAAEFTTAASLEGLAADLRGMPSVDVVQLDTAWVNRLNAILDTVRSALVVAAALLALGVMVIVGNTIRLDIQNRRTEIEVTKLVGGSDAFVRRPFLYNGLWYGLGGGLIAWIITLAVIGVLREPIGRVAGLYGSAFELGGLDPRATLILLGSGIVLGWLGSYLAASRHLRAIEPT
ncbi:cell division protein FtsX [Steroidobacter sp. S1-65]|uniref:Cell division protein FtsX n=1 Tax=Steroidobacter gossypii TaxID=2805490 RepID=A0ABS1WS57_9GAMM|nr:permease-like cell division protein FtsX [Steroidobacter gossypii]MBM0103810.1 cell division protein FtsX [Steroidobacter gossypii]